MTSKNTPNGGKLLKAVNELIKNNIKVQLGYEYGIRVYPDNITIELTPTKENTVVWRMIDSFAPWYHLIEIKTQFRNYDDGRKWAHTYIKLQRVWI